MQENEFRKTILSGEISLIKNFISQNIDFLERYDQIFDFRKMHRFCSIFDSIFYELNINSSLHDHVFRTEDPEKIFHLLKLCGLWEAYINQTSRTILSENYDLVGHVFRKLQERKMNIDFVGPGEICNVCKCSSLGYQKQIKKICSK